MKDFIRVNIKKPGMQPVRQLIPNTLKALQIIVGGHIECVPFCSDAVILCNEEGKLKDLRYNVTMFGMDFVGTLIFVGVSGEEFDDFPGGLNDWLYLFRKAARS